MKKIITFVLVTLLLPSIVFGQLSIPQGGTGRSAFTGGDFIFANTASFQRLTGTTTPFFSNFSWNLATGTNATTTNFFSTTASSTNLFSSLLTVGGTGLMVDSSRRVGIGVTPSSGYVLDIKAPTSEGNVRFTAQDSVAPRFHLNRTDTSIAADDEIAGIEFNQDTGDRYVLLQSFARTVTNGSEVGEFRISTIDSGAEAARLTVKGANVGIGTTTPNNKLDIFSATKSAIGFSGASGNTNKWTIGYDMTNNRFAISSSTALGTNDKLVIDGSGNVGIGSTTPFGVLGVENIGSGASFVVNDVANDSTPFLIDASGKVGIGTAAPALTLHVYGASGSHTVVETPANQEASFRWLKAGSTKWQLYSPASSYVLRFYDGVAGLDSIEMNSGDLYLLRSGSSVQAGGFGFRADTSYGFYFPSGSPTGQRISLRAAGTDVLIVDANQRVGIGESAPGSKLSVSGGATIGASYDTTAAPSNGLLVEGNVGIGTSTPTDLLHVHNNTATSTLYISSGGAGLGGEIVVEDVDGK